MSATANPKVRLGFGPLLPGFIRTAMNDVAAIEALADSNPNIVAVFLETIQGEGGINPATIQFLQDLKRLCDEKNWLLMLDEVQCGTGRTGKWFAHQWAGIVPDVMPLAKGLGSGVPIGAVVTGPKAEHVFKPGDHGSTFGGNPLAMRAGIETLAIIQEDNLLDNALTMGRLLKDCLQEQLGQHPEVLEIRAFGLMIGIELARPCTEMMARCAEQGLLISVTAGRVIRLLPPLIISGSEVRQISEIICPLILEFVS